GSCDAAGTASARTSAENSTRTDADERATAAHHGFPGWNGFHRIRSVSAHNSDPHQSGRGRSARCAPGAPGSLVSLGQGSARHGQPKAELPGASSWIDDGVEAAKTQRNA